MYNNDMIIDRDNNKYNNFNYNNVKMYDVRGRRPFQI